MYTNVSDEFKAALNGTEPVYCCKLDFGNNVTLNDLFSVSYSSGSCSESIVPGGTVIANAKVELSALPAAIKKGSTCTLNFGVNGEYAPQGVLTVKTIEKSGERLSVTLEDNMAKTEKGYFSSLSYPSTTLKMLSEIATKCGVAFKTSGLTAVTIKDKPEGYTCREIIGYIAGLYGKFAVCDRTGKIIFKWFDTTVVQLSDFCYDIPTVATDDSTVGRVVCGDFTAGTGTAITYDCLFMTQNQLNTVQKSLNGFKYRTGEIPLRLGNMLIDAWDKVSVTYDGETVNIPAANISMTYNGGLSMTIEAPATEQSADSGESYKSPAQKQAERITADIISAKQALLEKADITELNAQIANLENVYAAKADITELSAQIATIDNLTAKKADVEQLYAKKADIDTLVADTATLKSLKSDVANIDVLLSGKAGTGELTAIKLTAENAEIATALIKDLTAANFRSKTIETDDFTIKSSSGKLQIVGNTIQIKDKNNTARVQIGEDGKSDYGIYVTDASGKIMFTSYDGLHEDGIKSGIIKNDMVADDAHISGSKLDISSVIDGINADNSTYLNTSKVVIDGTKQTINAKFTELTTSIGSIGTRTSALESDLSGFRTTVSETYATTSAVDNIQVGGRNIVTGTSELVIGNGGHSSGHWRKDGTTGTIQTVDISDIPLGSFTRCLRLTATDASAQIRLGQYDIPLDKDSLYTLSCWVRSNSSSGVPIRLQPFYKSASDHSGSTQDIPITEEWQYVSFTSVRTPAATDKYNGAYIYLRPTAAGNYIDVCGIKLEKGNKPTDWSPAPEDTSAEITSLSSKQSSLEQTVDGFKATVESTYATNDSVTQKVSAVEQTAEKISWLVKSGTSASSMELTSEALQIIANTEIKGDVIVGGVIKSSNYVVNSTGMKLSLATGEWDSKYFKISNTGTITATGGTIGGWNIVENGITSTSSDNLMTVAIRPVNISGVPWLYIGKKAKASDTSWSYPFQLLPDGSIRCNNITINESGKGLTSSLTNGSYSQNITISSGTFSMTCNNTSSPNVYSARGSIHCGAIHRNIGGMFIDSANGVLINQAVKIDPYGITFMYPDSESVKDNAIYFQTSSDVSGYGRTRYISSSVDGVLYVGNPSKTLFLQGTPINSSRSITVVSDARMKNHIADLPSGSENLFDYLDGKSFFYNGDSSTAKNYGFIAQDVLSALQKCVLSTDDFAGFCDINGDGSQYALAYEQFIPLMWNEIKRLRKALSERS